VVGIVFDAGQGLQVACVGQGIQIDDADAVGNGGEDKVAADKSGTAGDQPGFGWCGHWLMEVKIRAPLPFMGEGLGRGKLLLLRLFLLLFLLLWLLLFLLLLLCFSGSLP